MRRFKAPTANGAVLAEPGFDALPPLVEANRRVLNRGDVVVGGLPLRELRAMARREAVAAAREFMGEASPGMAIPGLSPDVPLILAGHQPELSHPGVWVKSFALNRLARQVGGVPLNLVVDNDTLKSASLRFPTWDDRDPASVRLQNVPFDDFAAEVPYEDRGVLNRDLFESFADRAASLCNAWGFAPLLPAAWGCVLAAPGTVGERFAAARRCFEREWGCDNLELPVSRLAGTEAFARFVNHLLADLPRFREVYNAAVQRYRDANGIRSRSHPVPDLHPGEAPFWGPRGPDGRRGRVTATHPDPATLRPRALTLTLFARVCLGDFFVHGIGGGKYDEVTDAIVRDYFGVEPPAYQVLSATLHLPVPTFPAREPEVRAAWHTARDLHWNPQRHLPADVAAELRGEKAALAAAEPADHRDRVQWFHDLRHVTEALRPLLGERAGEAERGLATAREQAAANASLLRRDFAWVLYPEGVLRDFCRGFL